MKSLILTVLVFAACLQLGQGQVPQIISFQGNVTVGGTNYQGAGLFKFALVSEDGVSTYWSNDGSGGEPRKAVTLAVVDGLYEVQLGDPQEGMLPISPSIFENSDVRVRVWFSAGSSVGSQPFQMLQPDTRIERRFSPIRVLCMIQRPIRGENSRKSVSQRPGTITSLSGPAAK